MGEKNGSLQNPLSDESMDTFFNRVIALADRIERTPDRSKQALLLREVFSVLDGMLEAVDRYREDFLLHLCGTERHRRMALVRFEKQLESFFGLFDQIVKDFLDFWMGKHQEVFLSHDDAVATLELMRSCTAKRRSAIGTMRSPACAEQS